jgi:glycosyltransferase involved in cell wall biosynthesis
VGDTTVLFSCYNQERYVESALRSVLAQDVQELQVVVWDDASTDATPEIVRRLVAEYQGPFEIVPVLNRVNQLHWALDEMVARAEGDFLIIADGDDVALPNRVSRMRDAWRRHDVSLVASNAVIIDGEGRRTGVWADPNETHGMTMQDFLQRGWLKVTIGAGLGFERALWDEFGPRHGSIVSGDIDGPLTFWALLARGVHLDLETTLLYRVHAGQNAAWSAEAQTQDDGELDDIRVHAITARLSNWAGMLDALAGHALRHPDDTRVPAIEDGLRRLLHRDARELGLHRRQLLRGGERQGRSWG